MIKITIEQVTTLEYQETVNFPVEQVPTDKLDSYNKPMLHTRYEAREITKREEQRTVLLSQEINDVTAFDLKAVIAVINGIDRSKQ